MSVSEHPLTVFCNLVMKATEKEQLKLQLGIIKKKKGSLPQLLHEIEMKRLKEAGMKE